jgi:hypothetical protein
MNHGRLTATRRAPAPSEGPGIHVGQLRFVTDRALSSAQAESLGAEFTRELDATLQAERPRARLHVGELVIESPAHRLGDRTALRQLAQAAARRILDRTPE